MQERYHAVVELKSQRSETSPGNPTQDRKEPAKLCGNAYGQCEAVNIRVARGFGQRTITQGEGKNTDIHVAGGMRTLTQHEGVEECGERRIFT